MAFLLPNFYPTLLVQTKFKHKPIHQTLSQIRPNSRNCSLSQLSSALQTPTLSEDAQVETSKGAQDKKNKQQRDDFYVNLGLAVRTLREDMPLIFAEDLNYDIYRDDITFMDPLNTFTGIENYKLIFWALRFHGKILFRDISLEIYRIWQPSENVILIRWNMKGVPRVPWEAKGEFQGSSRYKLDRKGKIYEHKVDNLAFNFPQKLQPASSVLDLVTACPASPKLTFLWGPDSCGCILIFMVGVLSSSQRNFKSRSFLASTRWFSKLMRYFTDILYIDFVSYMYTSLTFCTIY